MMSTDSDLNFVTFVLFVVTNYLTTKDAKHTKEETQRTPWRKSWAQREMPKELRTLTED